MPHSSAQRLLISVLSCRSRALDGRHSAAVVHYMLQVLPHLHEDSSTPAASLLLHILSSSATSAQLLQSATALLTQLPLHGQTALSADQVHLACDLLAHFTADAFQGLPKGLPKGLGKGRQEAASHRVVGLELLLQLVRSGVHDSSSKGQQLSEKLRLAAFQQLGAELYNVMPVQQQMEAFLVSISKEMSPRFVHTTVL